MSGKTHNPFMGLILPILLFFPILHLGCKKSEGPSKKVENTFTLTSPENMETERMYSVSHATRSLIVQGVVKGPDAPAIEPAVEGAVLNLVREEGKTSFTLEWKLKPGKNEVTLVAGQAKMALETFRYTKELEAKLAQLEKGLTTKISLPALEYRFDKTITILPSGHLELPPGTRFRFGPKAGLDVLGTLTAQGTLEKPIHFTGIGQNKSWRNIAIGEKSAGESHLAHCRISAGRGALFLSVYQDKFYLEEGLVRNNWTVGGGLLIIDSSPTVRNCVITGNKAHNGGGVYLYNSQSVLESNQIEKNEATNWGGGILVMKGRPRMEKNQISQNKASKRGGGMAVIASKSVIREGEITGNKAGSWGGGVFIEKGETKLIRNVISGNVAKANGGGVALRKATLKTELMTNRIKNNQALSGGGVAVDQGNPVFNDNTLSQNQAEHNGGGAFLTKSQSTWMNNEISSNQAGKHGGGVYSNRDETNYTSNQFRKNRAGENGGGLYFHQCRGGSLVGTEVYENVAANKGGPFCIVQPTVLIQSSNSIRGNEPSSPETIGQ